MKTGEDNYLMGIEALQDGRVQLIHSTGDLETWLRSFKQGPCVTIRSEPSAECVTASTEAP